MSIYKSVSFSKSGKVSLSPNTLLPNTLKSLFKFIYIKIYIIYRWRS